MRDLRTLDPRLFAWEWAQGIGLAMSASSACLFVPVIMIETRTGRKKHTATLRVIADCPPGWEHVSVSLPDRCPTWDEMDMIKRIVFEPHEVVMQLHPAEAEHRNCHPHCLHMWRSLVVPIPLPPSDLVAPKGYER